MSRWAEICLLNFFIHSINMAHLWNTPHCARCWVHSGGQKRLVHVAPFLSWGCFSGCVMGGAETAEMRERLKEAGGREKSRTWQENQGSGAWDLWELTSGWEWCLGTSDYASSVGNQHGISEQSGEGQGLRDLKNSGSRSSLMDGSAFLTSPVDI